jgi:hypothetical protein
VGKTGSDGQKLAHAIEQLEHHLGSHDGAIADTIEAVYRARIGEDMGAAPNAEQQAGARDQLCGLQLGKRLPWFRD